MTSFAAATDSYHVHSSLPLATDQVQGAGYFEFEVEMDMAALELETDMTALELETDTSVLDLETEADMSKEMSKQERYLAD
jgi:hypothetical protein